MGYDNNTYISPKGREYTNYIFDLLFKNDGETMDISSVSSVVGHFRGPSGSNLHNTCQLMKKFIKGYESSQYQQGYNSGIHVCPYCSRRDFMWTWEYVDFGIRNEDETWTSSIKLEQKSYELGANLQDSGYRFECRVRCNTVTTCQDCHTTVTGEFSSCRNCSSSNVVKVGCGKESYATHLVKEVQASEWLASTGMTTNAQSTKGVSLMRGGTTSGTQATRPFFYRVQNQGPSPKGLVVEDAQTAFQYIPHLEIGYETYDKEHRRPYGYCCPNEECDFERYAPVGGEDYDVPMAEPAQYEQNKMKVPDKMVSTGPAPTLNQNGQDAQGGLVNNMGNCPNPSCDGVKLVPRIQNKEILPKIVYKSGDTVLGWRTSSHGGRVRSLGPVEEEGLRLLQTYSNWQINRWKNSKPDSYPFSPMTRAFTRTAKEVCKRCYPSYGSDRDYFWSASEGLQVECRFCREWKPEWRELDPESRLNPALPLQIVSPQPLRFGLDSSPAGLRVGSNPESAAGTVWAIRLECQQNPEYGMLQNFLQLWSLNEIPETPTSPPMTGQGIQICPNDAGALVSEEVRRKELEEKAKTAEDEEGITKVPSIIQNLDGPSPDGSETLASFWRKRQELEDVPRFIGIGGAIEIINPNPESDTQLITSVDLLKYRPLDERANPFGRVWQIEIPTTAVAMPMTEDSYLGVTSAGYTFVVTEGRSKEAFRHKRTNKWVDASGPCISYHDRTNPSKSFTSPITYPRWTQAPESHIENTGIIMDEIGSYYWNHSNHFAQDFIKVNDYLALFMRNTEGEQTLMSRYHDFHEISEPLLQPDNGTYVRIFECKTCKAMYDIGVELQAKGVYAPPLPVLKYYQKRYMANEDGETTNAELFPQECLDAEMEAFPEITDFAVDDGSMIPLGRGGEKSDGSPRTGKEMLSDPKLIVSGDD